MSCFTHTFTRVVAVLIVSIAGSNVFGGGIWIEDDGVTSWDLVGTDSCVGKSEGDSEDELVWDYQGSVVVNGSSRRQIVEDLWDLVGTDAVGRTSPVEFHDVGIVLSVTPVVVDGRQSVEPLFLLYEDEILLNVGSAQHPEWNVISRQEFQLMLAELEPGFGLVADVYEEGQYIIRYVLFI